jgi:putative membrane protein
MLARSPLVLAGAAALLVLAACAGRQKAETPAAAAEQAEGTMPSDPQILGILRAANDVDIAGGYQAERMARDAGVQSFGKAMVTDHAALNQQTDDLASRLELVPEESETSKQLRENGDRALERRQSLAGDDFDRTYLDDEIAFHQALLGTIDEVLLPNADHPELKQLIETARPQIASHLAQAQRLKENLGQQAQEPPPGPAQ